MVGIGGAGGNIVARVRNRKIKGVDYLAINTDKQALRMLPKPIKKIAIGKKITAGLGTGMNPDIGRAAAEEDEEIIKNEIKGANIIFALAGFGGGTGTGATPVIVEIARKLGALTIVLATRPFHFEGSERRAIAENGFREVLNFTDTAIFLSNEQLFSHLPAGASLLEGFDIADSIFADGISGILDILIQPGIVNLDFVDLRTILENGGQGILSVGIGEGDKKGEAAVKRLLRNIPSDFSLKRAKKIIYSISGGTDLTLTEAREVIENIREFSNPDAKIIFGISVDVKLHHKVKITLIATSLEGAAAKLPSLSVPSEQRRVKPIEVIGKDKGQFGVQIEGSRVREEEKKSKKVSSSSKLEQLKEEGSESSYDELDIPAFIRRRLHK